MAEGSKVGGQNMFSFYIFIHIFSIFIFSFAKYLYWWKYWYCCHFNFVIRHFSWLAHFAAVFMQSDGAKSIGQCRNSDRHLKDKLSRWISNSSQRTPLKDAAAASSWLTHGWSWIWLYIHQKFGYTTDRFETVVVHVQLVFWCLWRQFILYNWVSVQCEFFWAANT